MLGYRWEGDQRVIVPEEAERVRWLFSRFNNGDISYKALAKEYNEKGYRTLSGGLMTESSASDILSNEKYAGDVMLQKRCRKARYICCGGES